jgi:predicted permease
MQETLLKLIPIFLFFGLGILLKRLKFAEPAQGDFILKFVFFITLPALILLTLSKTSIDLEKISLPFINIAVNFSCMLCTLVVAKFIKMERETVGAMLVNTMIVNNAFMFPFILAGFGGEGFAVAALFDFGNAVMTATFTFALAFKYGGEGHTSKTMIMKVIKSPLFWALALAIILSVSGTALPVVAVNFLEPLGNMTAPLILISLGIFFSPKLLHWKLVTVTLLIRMVLGLVIGFSIATLLGLEGTVFAVVCLCSAAPIGFNSLTFSSLAKLDVEYTSSAVSVSILIGMFYIPFLIYAINIWQ